MSSKRKFTGVPFTPKPKCAACEHLEQCRNSDNSLTIKIMVVECESFYYLFKQLEEFEKLPILGENEEKIKKLLMIIRNDTRAFHRSHRRLL